MKRARYLYSFFAIFVLLFNVFASSATSIAEESPVNNIVERDEAKIELIAGKLIDNRLKFGLKMNFPEGWKTYWRTPGDGGLPIQFDWSKSENISDISIRWPAPKRSVQFDSIENYGYQEEVVFPLSGRIADPNQEISLYANVNYAVCKEICLFFEDKVALKIPPSYSNKEHSEIIDKYLELVPADNGNRGLFIDGDIAISDEDEAGGVIRITATSKKPFKEPDIIIEGDPNMRFPKPNVSISSSGKKAIFTTNYEKMVKDTTLAHKPLTLTLVDGNNSVELRANTGEITETQSIYLIILFALIGGLILNVMPCVLPVLSLKLLGVIDHGGKHHSRVRASFLSSAAGIIFSFLVLAGVVTAIKSTGQEVGWGFHFQEPYFIIAVVMILTIFTANLWDLFHIRAPQFINDLVPKEDDHTLMGHFMLGALATLLATPCTAPFLGTAVGFAFTQGTKEIFITFTAMGVGLAGPYLLLALRPQIVSKLPKPGVWMNRVKYVLGFFLASTALWLIWVLGNQLGREACLTLLFLSAIIIFLFMILKNKKDKGTGISLISATVILSFYLPMQVSSSMQNEIDPSEVWVPFKESLIKEHVNDGKVVFVDVTADWCLTCKANKLLVLNTKEVLAEFSKSNVVAMKADWTKPKKHITNYLSKHNRQGIPFNVVYGPSAPRGVVLSELLTQDAVLAAIKKAK